MLACLLLLFSQIRFIAPVNDLGGQTEVDVIMIAFFCGWRYWSSFVLLMPKHNLRLVISLGLFSCTPRSFFSTVFGSAQLWRWCCQKEFCLYSRLQIYRHSSHCCSMCFAFQGLTAKVWLPVKPVCLNRIKWQLYSCVQHHREVV